MVFTNPLAVVPFPHDEWSTTRPQSCRYALFGHVCVSALDPMIGVVGNQSTEPGDRRCIETLHRN